MQTRNARGKTGHHVTFELTLSDGRVLRTRISHPPDRSTYGPRLWAHILRDQLLVSETEFWACVREQETPLRDRPVQTGPSIPAGVLSQLLAHGIPEAEVRSMSRAQAIDRLNLIWSEQA